MDGEDDEMPKLRVERSMGYGGMEQGRSSPRRLGHNKPLSQGVADGSVALGVKFTGPGRLGEAHRIKV